MMLERVTGVGRPFGGSSGTYNVQASELARDRCLKTLKCSVVFLDDTQHVFEIDKSSKGQIILDAVFQHLELTEKDYFGLQFSDNGSLQSSELMRWLDPTKSIKKQLHNLPYTLWLRVKFYVSDPSKLAEEYTRYHFFLQIKKDITEAKLLLPPSTACLLASYSLQSELGDYSPDEHGHSYVSGLKLVINQTEDMEKKIMELHKLHSGQSPADAEFHFLDHAKRLDMYGVDLHTALDCQDREIELGVSCVGLVVFSNNIKINTFSWAKIVKISFKRKKFFIQLRREVSENYDSVVGFNLLSYRSCKNLWKSCVEHHSFFRLHTPQIPSRRHVFTLGSKFRYSGRTEYQTLEESKRRARLERTFLRSPSRAFARQTVPGLSDERIKKTPSRAGNGVGAPSYKVQSFGSRQPRKAWEAQDDGGFVNRTPGTSTPILDTAVSEGKKPFSPPLSHRINYADDEAPTESDTEHPPLYDPSAANTTLEDISQGVLTIKMSPDEAGKFGFNVKGGRDQDMPIIVTRVAPNTPAEKCYPRLNEGDQVLKINGEDVSAFTHDQVVSIIRASTESHSQELLLTVRQNAYMGEELEEPTFQYVPETPHVAPHTPRGDVLAQSMLLLKESLESEALTVQFDQLYRRKSGMTILEAKKTENISRNRYRDISPYDSTRVVLSGCASGDYINASHVKMEIPRSGIVNRYIATQGPLPSTCNDFWQMVWEAESTVIVMVTTVKERGRAKCYEYWPDLYETQDTPTLTLRCLKQTRSPSFGFREFSLIKKESGEERHISHMQYLAWPDHGVPADATEFLEFVQQVRAARSGQVEPTVVHCSAGIGRTGVLILMETAMCLIEANEPVYPLDLTRTMRDQRAMMIQTASQYKFVCEAILKVYSERIVTPLPEYQR